LRERRPEMKLENLPEQLFVSAVCMNPALHGFSGVLVEIYREKESSGGSITSPSKTLCRTKERACGSLYVQTIDLSLNTTYYSIPEAGGEEAWLLARG
jgi:hypothetical protein